ncbi:HD domain-containing protein [Aliarcobacter thereius]|uniref:HD domain-containing protein n=1 Tax=Aliarcobacter thereius TaxID=544718 RepID=A0A5R9H7Q9_9BACT|nr:HD domain-containing phosphohydrolase [Aliarcobacter thereius]TLS72120.1 HD domain-containing protein [Aliarcobacter thereius]
MKDINKLKKDFSKALEENNKEELNSIFFKLVEKYEDIENSQKEIIFKMGAIGENRTKDTGNHIKRVAEFSKLLVSLYGLSEEESELLKLVSPMHDIGKVSIPDNILNKPGKLNDEEFELMKTHTRIGFDILNDIDKPLFNLAKTIAYEHHERWEGGGYPRGISKEDIHIFSRITTVADVFDVLGSQRSYKSKWEDDKIFEFMKKESGKLFEPKLIELLINNKDKFLEIRKELED